MKIKFLKDITKPSQDGFGLIYEVNDKQLEVQISRSFLGLFNINTEDINDLFEQFNLEPMIDSIDTLYSKENNFINKIELDSDGLKIKGKVYYSVDELKIFIVINNKS